MLWKQTYHYKIGGNVLNTGGFISNLPEKAVVEVPCLVDSSGVTPTYFGELPEQLAALNRTNINTQLLTIEAAMTRKKEHIYHAAMLDPHTAAELSLDDIVSLCDELIEAHGDWLPKVSIIIILPFLPLSVIIDRGIIFCLFLKNIKHCGKYGWRSIN